MGEPQEIRSPVQFFGGDSRGVMGVDADFRPNVTHTFDGDGAKEAETAAIDSDDEDAEIIDSDDEDAEIIDPEDDDDAEIIDPDDDDEDEDDERPQKAPKGRSSGT